MCLDNSNESLTNWEGDSFFCGKKHEDGKKSYEKLITKVSMV